MKLGLLITALCMGTIAFADPIITDVTARQRYPWNGKVDISYTVSGIEAAAKQNGWITSLRVMAKDNDADMAYTATTLTGDTSFTDGTHALVWDMTAQGLTFKSTNVTFNVTCAIKDALYCVINLSEGSSATSYPVTYLSEIPGGSWSDEYKTTKLVLRRIDPGTCVVTVDKPYYIGVFEMTQKQYELITGQTPSYFAGNDMYPVDQVSYDMLRGSNKGSQYPSSTDVDDDSCVGKLRNRTGIHFDLPTEAQWEYACRAGTATTFNYGDSVNGDYMWYDNNSGACAHDVGTRKANLWGLYDMHGNVWEWCLEWYSVGSYRVLRGGSWHCFAVNCTSSDRGRNYSSSDNEDHGFRLARILPNDACDSCSGETDSCKIDLTDNARTARKIEQIGYSVKWSADAGSSVRVKAYPLGGELSNRRGLIHRWSFNGTLEDSVGGQTAEAIGNVSVGSTEYTLSGGSNGSSYISLGTDLMPTTTSGVTLEFWATEKSKDYCGRVFEIGESKDTDFHLSWSKGGNSLTIREAGIENVSGLKTFETGTKYHLSIVMTKENGYWIVSCTQRDALSGEILSSIVVSTQGTNWSPAIQKQKDFWLGHTHWPDDTDANASYDEVRIWNRALSQFELSESAKRGPDDVLTILSVPDGTEGQLLSESSHDGTVLWPEQAPGMYLLTHDVLTNGISTACVMMAPFVVPDAIPDLGENPTDAQVATAISGSTDTRLSQYVTNGVEYVAYRSWATNVQQMAGGLAGTKAVHDSPHAWLSYALDSAVLVTNAPVQGEMRIASFEKNATTGKFDFLVAVDGITVGTKALPEKLATLFSVEGCGTVDGEYLTANVSFEFETPSDGKVLISALPNDENATQFFIKAKMNP